MNYSNKKKHAWARDGKQSHATLKCYYQLVLMMQAQIHWKTQMQVQN
jgi:hypothetical protein